MATSNLKKACYLRPISILVCKASQCGVQTSSEKPTYDDKHYLVPSELSSSKICDLQPKMSLHPPRSQWSAYLPVESERYGAKLSRSQTDMIIRVSTDLDHRQLTLGTRLIRVRKSVVTSAGAVVDSSSLHMARAVQRSIFTISSSSRRLPCLGDVAARETEDFTLFISV